MLLSALLIWLELLMVLGTTNAQITDNSAKSPIKFRSNELKRTYSEVKFIQTEFGIEYTPMKLSRREKLSLALTNAISDNQ
jgi:hypothetical protein